MNDDRTYTPSLQHLDAVKRATSQQISTVAARWSRPPEQSPAFLASQTWDTRPPPLERVSTYPYYIHSPAILPTPASFYAPQFLPTPAPAPAPAPAAPAPVAPAPAPTPTLAPVTRIETAVQASPSPPRVPEAALAPPPPPPLPLPLPPRLPVTTRHSVDKCVQTRPQIRSRSRSRSSRSHGTSETSIEKTPARQPVQVSPVASSRVSQTSVGTPSTIEILHPVANNSPLIAQYNAIPIQQPEVHELVAPAPRPMTLSSQLAKIASRPPTTTFLMPSVSNVKHNNTHTYSPSFVPINHFPAPPPAPAPASAPFSPFTHQTHPIMRTPEPVHHDTPVFCDPRALLAGIASRAETYAQRAEKLANSLTNY